MEPTLLDKLATTNLLLGILAAVAVLQIVALAALGLWMRARLDKATRQAVSVAEYVLPTVNRIRDTAEGATRTLAAAESVLLRVDRAVNEIGTQVSSASSSVGRVIGSLGTAAAAGSSRLRAVEAGVRRGFVALRGKGPRY